MGKVKSLCLSISVLFKKTEQPSYVEWVILYSVFGILFVSHVYRDLIGTVSCGIGLWSAIENGQFLDFYSLSFGYPELISGMQMPGYDFPIYVIFAIWNFPLYILERSIGVEIYYSFGCLLYMKLMLLPFLFGCTHTIRRICQQFEMTAGQVKWAVFLFLSSGFVMSSIFVMTQYDIIMIFFLLLGLLAYIKNDMKLFLIFFAVAVSLKLFALMVFVPLVFLKHKKVSAILGCLLCSLSVTLISKLLFMFGTGSENGLQRVMLDMINSSRLVYGHGMLLYVAAFAALCIFCYVKKIDDDNEYKKYSIYVPLLSFSLFFIFAAAFPYWYIMLTPFLPILIFQNSRHFKTNLLLDTFAFVAMILFQQIHFYWCFDVETLKHMLIPKIFGAVETLNNSIDVSTFYSKLVGRFFDLYEPTMNALFTACMVAILFLNFPRNDAVHKELSDAPVVIERSVVWFRLFAAAGFCFMPVAAYIASIVVYGVT